MSAVNRPRRCFLQAPALDEAVGSGAGRFYANGLGLANCLMSNNETETKHAS
jgi:hypothetical protein